MIDKDDPRQAAEDCRRLADFLERCRARPEIITGLREEAEKLDPPYQLDRSLRGWVLVTEPCGATWVWRAYEGGLVEREETMTWDGVVRQGWKVEQLHVLQPNEVTVKIPPVSEWPEETYTYTVGGWFRNYIYRHQRIVTREEAERMEAEND